MSAPPAPAGPRARRLAAVDIGTVTTRLLVADVSAEGVDEVVRRSVITHLGEGLDASGRLSGAAIERVATAAGGFAAEARELGAERTIALATSAARDAANGSDLLRALEAAGVAPRIIVGDEEARLSFAGATSALDEPSVLVADPGGGSTELILGSAVGAGEARRVEIAAARSVDVGARRMTERFLTSDPPRATEIDSARAWAAEAFRPFFDGLRCRPRLLVTLAGTVTSLVAIKLGLAEYDGALVHGQRLSGADLAVLREELAAMPLAERRGVAGLEPDRAQVIVAGTLIVETVLGLAGLDSTVVSEHDILYGIVLDAFASASLGGSSEQGEGVGRA